MGDHQTTIVKYLVSIGPQKLNDFIITAELVDGNQWHLQCVRCCAHIQEDTSSPWRVCKEGSTGVISILAFIQLYFISSHSCRARNSVSVHLLQQDLEANTVVLFVEETARVFIVVQKWFGLWKLMTYWRIKVMWNKLICLRPHIYTSDSSITSKNGSSWGLKITCNRKRVCFCMCILLTEGPARKEQACQK